MIAVIFAIVFAVLFFGLLIYVIVKALTTKECPVCPPPSNCPYMGLTLKEPTPRMQSILDKVQGILTLGQVQACKPIGKMLKKGQNEFFKNIPDLQSCKEIESMLKSEESNARTVEEKEAVAQVMALWNEISLILCDKNSNVNKEELWVLIDETYKSFCYTLSSE